MMMLAEEKAENKMGCYPCYPPSFYPQVRVRQLIRILIHSVG